MLELADIPFFEPLAPASLEQLQRSVRIRDYPQGSVIVEKGDPGQYFQAIADGAVSVQQADRFGRKSGVFLGPGRIFGEMSLFSGNKIAAAARATFAECAFADLHLPTAVVAADLASRERVIFDRGPVALATSAIPGFFPPVAADSSLMVDGGMVSWLPVDVPDTRRFGLPIAINVLPFTHEGDLDVLSGFANLKKTLRKPLGLKSVLGASWELLVSWGSSNEALKADLVVTPKTPSRAGYAFDRFDELVQCGRDAALERVETMAQSVQSMLCS
ncbi:MAG: cyclic nucleotide-binding domain-containing protein [Gammaproteobacteria bacterium]|jgi:predicted acylesterase/phospholipase RssA